MTGEVQPGDSGEEAYAAERATVSQETLGLLLEAIRERCSSHFLEMVGNSGIMWKGTQDGKQLQVNLDCYGDNSGPSRHDADGSMSADTTGRYKHSHDNFYYDTGVQATISKLEKADESQADGKKVFTSYEITRSDEQLEIEKRVRPFGLPVFLQRGDQLIPAEDNPPLITTQERQASEQREDAIGLSTVSESEANALIELLRAI